MNCKFWRLTQYETKSVGTEGKIKFFSGGLYPETSECCPYESELDLKELLPKITDFAIRGDTLFLSGKGEIILIRLPKKIASKKKKAK